MEKLACLRMYTAAFLSFHRWLFRQVICILHLCFTSSHMNSEKIDNKLTKSECYIQRHHQSCSSITKTHASSVLHTWFIEHNLNFTVFVVMITRAPELAKVKINIYLCWHSSLLMGSSYVNEGQSNCYCRILHCIYCHLTLLWAMFETMNAADPCSLLCLLSGLRFSAKAMGLLIYEHD